MILQPTRRNQIPSFLVLTGLGAWCCLSPVAEASSWKQHTADLALEIGQLTAPAPVVEMLESADMVRDTSATAAGATTAISVVGSSGPVILSKLAAVGGPVAAGALSGFDVAGVQNKLLYSDCDNADACDATAVAGYAGAG